MSSDQPVPPSIPPLKKPGSPGAARPSAARPMVVRPVNDVPAQGSAVVNPGASSAAPPKASAQETTATPIVPRAAPRPTPTPPAAKEPIAKAPATPSPSAAAKPASPTSVPTSLPASIPVPRVAARPASTVPPVVAPKTQIAPLPALTVAAPAPPRTTTSPAVAAGNEESAHEAPETPARGPMATSMLRALKSATATVAGATVAAGALRATKFPPSANGAPPRPDSTKADPTIAANDTHAASAAPRNTARSGAAPDGARMPAPAAARDGAPRRVRLSVSRVDPWSVMKLSFLLSVAVGVMIVVAAAVVWFVLDGLAVFTKVNDMITEIAGKESPIDILKYVEFSRVVAGATMVGVVDVILLTALSTIGAFLYNITAALVGGVSLTLTDD
ncbi:DUF3566 domain-containing protein [Pengzhenrongella sp.]|uniref:DUF3566 domain-containing protein n=1 Tax=Pengzhenrongella sp. TaxID=2888820 RepID=UPI002F92D5E7